MLYKVSEKYLRIFKGKKNERDDVNDHPTYEHEFSFQKEDNRLKTIYSADHGQRHNRNGRSSGRYDDN